MKWALDAFCGVGGITRGLQQAGYKVLGVDRVAHPDYCGDDFIQSDAVEFTWRYGNLFDLRHGSPPCQAHCTLTKGTNQGRVYPDLIAAWREAALGCDGPTMLENVPSSPLRPDLVLCGEMFGLRVIRHRIFETHGFSAAKLRHVPHRGRVQGWRHGVCYPGYYFAVYGDGGGKGTTAEWQAAMGIDWTEDRRALAQAVPPRYAEHVAGSA